MAEKKAADGTRSRVIGIRMNTDTFALLCKAARLTRNGDGEPKNVTTFVRDEALNDARAILANPDAHSARAMNLRVRILLDDKDVVRKAAETKGMRFSAYMSRVAERSATRLIQGANAKIVAFPPAVKSRRRTGSASDPGRSSQGR